MDIANHKILITDIIRIEFINFEFSKWVIEEACTSYLLPKLLCKGLTIQSNYQLIHGKKCKPLNP